MKKPLLSFKRTSLIQKIKDNFDYQFEDNGVLVVRDKKSNRLERFDHVWQFLYKSDWGGRLVSFERLEKCRQTKLECLKKSEYSGGGLMDWFFDSQPKFAI